MKLKSCFFMLMILAAFVVSGCSGFQLSSDTNHQAMAYLAGKGTAVAVYKISPKAAPPIEQGWMDLMGRCNLMTEIPAAEMQQFFNGIMLKNVPAMKGDPYGLAGDLAFFSTLYGAQFNPAGEMVMVQPIPMVTARAFQIGYEGGRSVALSLR